MRTILVMNPKGGAGKTTLATNLCGLLAQRKHRVLLADLDRQQSATHWLARRPAHCPKIARVNLDADKKAIKDYDPDWLVVDTAAGLHGEELADAQRAIIATVSDDAPLVRRPRKSSVTAAIASMRNEPFGA